MENQIGVFSQASELRRGTERPGIGRVCEWAWEQEAGRAAWQLAWISAAAGGELGAAGSRRALWIVSVAHT